MNKKRWIVVLIVLAIIGVIAAIYIGSKNKNDKLSTDPKESTEIKLDKDADEEEDIEESTSSDKQDIEESTSSDKQEDSSERPTESTGEEEETSKQPTTETVEDEGDSEKQEPSDTSDSELPFVPFE